MTSARGVGAEFGDGAVRDQQDVAGAGDHLGLPIESGFSARVGEITDIDVGHTEGFGQVEVQLRPAGGSDGQKLGRDVGDGVAAGPEPASAGQCRCWLMLSSSMK